MGGGCAREGVPHLLAVDAAVVGAEAEVLDALDVQAALVQAVGADEAVHELLDLGGRNLYVSAAGRGGAGRGRGAGRDRKSVV